jgi:sn-glycerol 3-phosphate transport system substrate-binding protein
MFTNIIYAKGGIVMVQGKFVVSGIVCVMLVLMAVSVLAAEPTKILFWHAMSARRMEAVDKVLEGFHAAHPEIRVEPQFTGTYGETLSKAIAAVRSGEAPHIVQVFEVGTQTMLDSGAIVPLFELEKPGEIDWGNVVGPILDYYTVGGKLYSMPFNSSTSMLYYNKDIFEKAGLDPNRPPRTFDEVLEMGKKIVESGAAPHAISFGWPDWQFEQAHTMHAQFYANNENGRKGRATEVYFNRDFGVKVLEKWTEWANAGVFTYGGPEYNANNAFLAGQIAMLQQSTSSAGSISKAAQFTVGTTFLPRFEEGYPLGNSVIGGATLWTMKGHSEEEYAAVWEFYKWLARPDVAVQWHKDTGYFPSSNAAVRELMDEGWFTAQPNFLTAFMQILTGVRRPESQGVLLGNFVEIRESVKTAIEKATSGQMSPKDALDEAANEADRILKEYAELYQ